MLRYLVPLPFFLKLGSVQTFTLELPTKSVNLRFINPRQVQVPPAPTTLLGIDSDSQLTPEELERIRLHFNNIIRAYRLITEETYNNGVIIQLAQDEFLKIILYGELDEQGNFIKEPRSIQFVKKLEMGTIQDQQYSEIRQLVESPESILSRAYDEILLQAKGFYNQENYRMAILEAVIALEIVISSIIRRLADEKEIQESEIRNFMVDVGLTGIMKVVLKLLIQEALPSDEVVSGCKGAISIRNDIIHEARLSVSPREALDAINNIETFIRHVQPLLSRS